MSDERDPRLTVPQEPPRLGLDDSFSFRCDPSLECFTRCCGDITIVLTPYDVLRMKKALGLDSAEFLARYTVSSLTAEQKVPVVRLKMDPETKRCPFVSEAGCRIYRDRPWACRMYPLGVRWESAGRAGPCAFYSLISEDFCQGHVGGRACTVREWIADQGLEEYEMLGASFINLMLHSFFWNTDEALPPEKIDMYYLACYDLDRFRRFVFDTGLLRLFEVDEARGEAMRSDDVELLEFAIEWLKFYLFGERTMKIKPSVLEARRQAAVQP